MPRATVFLALLITAPLSACRDSAFLKAEKTGTIDAYKRFIEANPMDENVEAAQERLADLELDEAKKVHTVVAYKRYLEEHPDDERANVARALLEGLRFNAAKQRNNALAWRQFIKDHPDGAHRDEADKALARCELEELPRLDDPQELARLASAHPDDDRGAQAGARLDDAVFKGATKAAQLFAYLKDYPAGAHRDEVRVKLLSLELEGLLVSGRLEEARALAAKAPLAKQVPGLDARLKHAEEVEKLKASKEAAVQRALPGYYLRSLDDLKKSLVAPDPMDRWEAAEELGQLVDVKAIDPLLEALRSARHTLVRERAFDSLERLLKALPADVADFELASRIEAAQAQASDAQVVLTLAVLLDLSGQLGRAATEYQKAFDPQAPDPVVLRRWVTLRERRGEGYSAAVAARQLSRWAVEQVKDTESAPDASTLSTARALCGARENAQVASGAIGAALTGKTEFADDVREYALRATEALKLSDARLRDVELKLLEADPHARRCGDDALKARMVEAEQRRLEALKQLTVKSPKAAALLK